MLKNIFKGNGMADKFKEIPLENLVPSKTNPRKEFNQVSLNELAESIKSQGVIQPIIVRRNGNPEDHFEIVSGERRFKASELAGKETVPAIIRELDDDQVLEIQIIENLQRVDIHPLHEAEGFKRILDTKKYTKELLAAKIGKSKSYIAQRIKLNDLIVEAKNKFYADKLMLGHALIIAKLQEKDQKDILKMKLSEMSVDQLNGVVEMRFLTVLNNAPFDVEKVDLVPEMGSCKNCVMRSGYDQSLFPELEADDYCTYKKCFDEKTEAHIEAELENAKEEGKELLKASTFYHTQDDSDILTHNDYEFEEDLDEEWKTGFEIKNAIMIDGPHKGFAVRIGVEKKEDTSTSSATDGEEVEEENDIEETVEAVDNAPDLDEISNYKIAAKVFEKFDKVREFTPRILQEIAFDISDYVSYSIECQVIEHLKLQNDGEDQRDLTDYVNGITDPKVLKDIIFSAIIFGMKSDYPVEFRKMANEEYDVNVDEIKAEVEKEFKEESKKAKVK